MHPKFNVTDFSQLHDFSRQFAIGNIPSDFLPLWQALELAREKFRFPAVHPDVGNFLQFIVHFLQPKKIFEFGSGYGHSAFWYLPCGTPESIILTERREDLQATFEELPWPSSFKNKLVYWQGDAFDCWANHRDADFILADGEKASYLKFLKLLEVEAKIGCVVAIDNSFWRGSFLDPANQQESAVKMREFHHYLSQTTQWRKIFLPFTDGLIVLQKL